MQRLMGLIRKASEEYGLIENGDRIAVGVSGGKDSVAMLYALSYMRRYLEVEYSLVGVTLDMDFPDGGMDYSPIRTLCEELDVEYHVKKTEIGRIIFSERQEQNPCSLCARMRRGSLHDAAKEYGCGKVALGHHRDDAVETFFMNLFIEGRIGCFQPKTYLSRKDLTLIRPMCLATEAEVARAARGLRLPVVKSSCPVDGHTTRQRMKEFIKGMEHDSPGFEKRVFGALRRSGIDGW